MAVLIVGAVPAFAQVTPTPTVPPPDDTPSVRVGGLIYADFTETIAPTITDAGGAIVSPSAFNVGRAYINVTGQLNHLFAFRITPDVARETGSGSSLAGSQTERLKYAYAQMNLDDWLWRGTYVRGGMIQTPYVDFEETIYRYRFQGTVFAEREGFMVSSDSGAAIRTLTPGGYGEIVAGVYNGEGYTRADPNNQKAIEVRGTLRPFPAGNLSRGLRLTVFYTGDHAVRDAEKRRAIGLVTFEHRFVTMAASYLDAVDQVVPTAPQVRARGASFWMTPKLPLGPPPVAPPAGTVRASLEGLFRYDWIEPSRAQPGDKQRLIAGVSYWPAMRSASYSAAFLLDYERVNYANFTAARPNERRLAVHMMVAF